MCRMRDIEVTIVVKYRKCQTRWKDDGVGWSGREYQRQLIDQEDKGRRLVAWRWSCRESRVVSLE